MRSNRLNCFGDNFVPKNVDGLNTLWKDGIWSGISAYRRPHGVFQCVFELLCETERPQQARVALQEYVPALLPLRAQVRLHSQGRDERPGRRNYLRKISDRK